MSEYISATDAAKKIRETLKRLGWSSRAVSVRAEYFSMGSAINVRIKRADVPLNIVSPIARFFEEIRRCEYTGDILSGGNMYVSCRYTRAAADSHATGWVDQLQKVVSQRSGSNELQGVGPYWVKRVAGCNGPDTFDIWSGGEVGRFLQSCYGIESAARFIGCHSFESRYTNISVEPSDPLPTVSFTIPLEFAEPWVGKAKTLSQYKTVEIRFDGVETTETLLAE